MRVQDSCRRLPRCSSGWKLGAAGFLASTLRASSQVDIIVDETYAPDPTTYDLAAFLATFNLTSADKAKYKWLAGATPKASCCAGAPSSAAFRAAVSHSTILVRPYLPMGSAPSHVLDCSRRRAVHAPRLRCSGLQV